MTTLVILSSTQTRSRDAASWRRDLAQPKPNPMHNLSRSRVPEHPNGAIDASLAGTTPFLQPQQIAPRPRTGEGSGVRATHA